jgi:hypothetical protein
MRGELLLLKIFPIEDITNTQDIDAAWVGGLDTD